MKRDRLQPMLISTFKGYTRNQLVQDVIAGIIVAIIALPLSVALALASGVGPEEGIYTAIIAGFIVSCLGGSRVQIAGPTAAFATIVAGIVARNGMEGLMLATLLAGAILILMGLLRMGALIRFIPYTITTGFTAGIAVTIFIGQLKDFFGVTYANGAKPVETMEKLEAFAQGFHSLNWAAVLVGVVCLAVLMVWPKVIKRIPGSLIAILVSIAMVKIFRMPVNTIGDLYSISNRLPTLHMPVFNMELMRTVIPDAFTIAILAGIESLLSCVVADGMVHSKHRSDMELVAQGTANFASALFGGIPATGAIARTAANVKNGGRTPVAGMVHAVVLILVLVVLMPYAALIPMPAIAAILFMVAYNMCQWRPFVHLCKTAPKSDIAVLGITFVLTVVFDLVIAIAVGMLLTCVLFVKRMSETMEITGWKKEHADRKADGAALRPLADNIQICQINGPLFFGTAQRVAGIALKEEAQCLVLRMNSVPALDATAIQALEGLADVCQTKGVHLVFSHMNAQPYAALKKAGFVSRIGEDHFCACMDDALERAQGYAGNNR